MMLVVKHQPLRIQNSGVFMQHDHHSIERNRPEVALLQALDGIAFLTDPKGRITAVGIENWNAFSRGNGAPELDAESVIGHKIFKFISGDKVKQQLRKTMQRISTIRDYRWVAPFRCDSPGCFRSMQQTVAPIFSAESCTGFIFQCIELQSYKRPPIDLFDFKAIARYAASDDSLPMVVMCSWCQRVRFESPGGKQWMEAEAYYAVGGSSKVSLSHSICEHCTDTIM